MFIMPLTCTKKTAYNSTFAIGGVSCSNESFVDNGSIVFQIKFCGKTAALRVAAKRQAVKKLRFSIS